MLKRNTFAILIATAVMSTTLQSVEVSSDISTQVMDCKYGGSLRTQAVNNLKYQKEIDNDYRQCVTGVLTTEAYRRNPILEREACLTFAYKLNGGINPIVNTANKTPYRLTDVYESIKLCQGK